MTKFEMIEAIRELNFTASVEFLSQFSPDELQEYLAHLASLDYADLSAAAAPALPYH